ncbi:MAG: RNB domain-containing ribonuclease [Eggerthellaceae bacterium]|nr:RNB domain-containing ribonuclease [Eggerthellaceae bacterium]
MARHRKHVRRAPRSNPRGVLVARAGGFGFVQTAEGEYFVPASAMGGAFDGDVVELAPIARRGADHGAGRARRDEDKPAARVVRVVDRAHDTVIGRYEVAEPFGVVVPEDQRISYDIFTMRADHPEVPDGALVRVRVTQFPTRHTAATGVVEEVIGTAGEATLGVDVIVARHKLETEFSAAALEEARAAVLDEDGALAAGYRDLRGRVVLTIDPADARDFDDAVSLERVPRGAGWDHPGADPAGEGLWRLGVHIADVSHYVPWNSSIDLDARRRATSVYLVDRVIPMLPEELSNELCSLKPGETRRSMTCDLYLDDAGDLVRSEVYPALIRSSARLTYDEAQEMIEEAGGAFAGGHAQSLRQSCSHGQPTGLSGSCGTRLVSTPPGECSRDGGGLSDWACPPPPADDPVAGRVVRLARIARQRQAIRRRAGAIDFSTTEAKVSLDAEGAPSGIRLRAKTDATELVEQAMILANEAVARTLEERGFPCLYRVHERPATDALAGLVPVFQEFPWFTEEHAARLMTGDPRAIQAILAASAGRPEGELVSMLLLRSMRRALYRPANDGHYGLGLDAYCHFTSPIRRYPDLVVHRMLRAALTRRPQKFDQEVAALPWIAEHSSDMEREADAAARESQELKMVEYLAQYVGESFPAIVSGVASYGLYARLECTAEGFIPLRALGREYFSFDAERHLLAGEDTGEVYRLGQRLPVTIVRAEAATRKLELRPAGRDLR